MMDGKKIKLIFDTAGVEEFLRKRKAEGWQMVNLNIPSNVISLYDSFDSIKKGMKRLDHAISLRNSMGAIKHWHEWDALNENCNAIASKLKRMGVAEETLIEMLCQLENKPQKECEYFAPAVEDLDGTSPYRITSTNPLPWWVLRNFQTAYIGISRLEFLARQYGFEIEAIEFEDED